MKYGVAFLAIAVLFVIKIAGQEMIRREYDRWAPALARALVRCAGLIYPAKAAHWANEVLNVQEYEGDEQESALWYAADVLLDALKIRILDSIRGLEPEAPSPSEVVVAEDLPRVSLTEGGPEHPRSRRGDRLAGCCRPRYPEPIVAYMSSKGCIRLHRPVCSHIVRLREFHPTTDFADAVWLEEPNCPYGKRLVWARVEEGFCEANLREQLLSEDARLISFTWTGRTHRSAWIEIEPMAGSDPDGILNAISRAGGTNYRFVRHRGKRRVRIEPFRL